MTDVRVGTMLFRGGEGQDGFFIEAGGLTGWFDGTPTRADQTEIPMGHGDFDVPVFQGSRVIQVSGLCHFDSPQRMEHYQNQLTGLLSSGDSGVITVNGPMATMWANVRRFGQPQFLPEVWGRRARYQVQFWSADPRKFGETRTFASGVPAYHYGNFPSTPYMQVAGAMPGGYTINGPAGMKYTVTAPLVAGIPHYIDMATGILRVSGYPVFGVVSQGDTWSLPPGVQTSMTLVPVSGSGTLTVSVVDTYV